MRRLISSLTFIAAGALMMHGRDRPQMVAPAEFRLLADTISGAIRVEALYIKPPSAGHIEGLPAGHEDTFIGECAGASAGNADNDLLLGDYVALPTPNTSNFVNIAGQVCWLRDVGRRVDCPPPEPECEDRKPPAPTSPPALPSSPRRAA